MIFCSGMPPKSKSKKSREGDSITSFLDLPNELISIILSQVMFAVAISRRAVFDGKKQIWEAVRPLCAARAASKQMRSEIDSSPYWLQLLLHVKLGADFSDKCPGYIKQYLGTAVQRASAILPDQQACMALIRNDLLLICNSGCSACQRGGVYKVYFEMPMGGGRACVKDV